MLAAGALCALVATSAGAAQRAPVAGAKADATSVRAAAPASAQGVKAAIDPATGALRQPTAAEIRALGSTPFAAGAASSRVSARPQNEAQAVAGQRRLRNGAVAIQLPEDRMSTLQATVGADGKVHLSHGDGDAHTQVAAGQGDAARE